MKKDFRWLMPLLGGLLCMVFLAPTVVAAASKRCDHCSAADFRDAAMSLGGGTHVVYSLPTREFREYSITGNAASLGPSDAQVAWAPLASGPLQDYLMALADLYAASAGTLKVDAPVRYGQLGIPRQDVSAFNAIKDNNLKAQLADALEDPSLWNAANKAVGSLLAAGAKLGSVPGSWSVTVPVLFPDGSQLNFRIQGSPYARAGYVAGTGRTPGGQLIPDTATTGQNAEWRGAPQDDIARINEYLAETLGASVSTSNRCASAEYTACAPSDSGLQCLYHQKCAPQ